MSFSQNEGNRTKNLDKQQFLDKPNFFLVGISWIRKTKHTVSPEKIDGWFSMIHFQ